MSSWWMGSQGVGREIEPEVRGRQCAWLREPYPRIAHGRLVRHELDLQGAAMRSSHSIVDISGLKVDSHRVRRAFRAIALRLGPPRICVQAAVWCRLVTCRDGVALTGAIDAPFQLGFRCQMALV